MPSAKSILPRDQIWFPPEEKSRTPHATPLVIGKRQAGYTFYSDMSASGVNFGKVMWVQTPNGRDRGRVEPVDLDGKIGGAGRVVHDVPFAGGYGSSESTAGWVSSTGQVSRGGDRDKARPAGYRAKDGSVFVLAEGKAKKIGNASSNWAAAAMILLFRH